MADVLPWELKADQGWAQRVAAFEQEAEGPVVVLSGECPHCHHPMAATVAVGPVVRMDATPMTFDFAARRKPAGADYVVWCNCTVDHKGPAGEVGCGSFGLLQAESKVPGPEWYRPGYWLRILLASLFSVHVATSRPKTGGPVPVTAPAENVKQAFVDDLLWAKKLDAGAVNALDNTRAAAGKWAPTITAITGAFGGFALIRGRADLTSVTHGWEIAVGVLVAAAAYLAIRSIMLAALAAEGTPSSVTVSAKSIRSYFDHAVDVAQWQLLASRIAAVLAVVVLGGAVGIVWFAPESTPKPPLYHVTVADGHIYCGAVAVNSDGTLKVTAPDGKTVVRAALTSSDVRAVVSTSACP